MNGLYEVSNFGNVRSLNYNREKRIKILKTGLDGWGYLYVALTKNKKARNKKIHRLVAENFIPNNNKFEQVNHIDGNKKNNNVNNLEWCNRQHNMQEAFRLGLVGRPKSKEHYKSKKVNQYDLEGNLIKTWDCIRDIERELNFRHTNIGACCRGKLKRAYGYVWKYAEELLEES